MPGGIIDLTLPEYPVDICVIARDFIYCYIIFLNALFTLNIYLVICSLNGLSQSIQTTVVTGYSY